MYFLYLSGVGIAQAQDTTAPPAKVRQLVGPGVTGTEDLPPRFSTTFTQAEFGDFLAAPAATLGKLGDNVQHMTVSVGTSVWMPKDKKWAPNTVLADLPPSQSWGWLCGYEDEMCVCHAVLM